MTALHAVDVSLRPLGQHYGGKYGASIPCPVCQRPALKYKTGRAEGVPWTDYAHRLSFDLDSKNEPRLTASEICRVADGSPQKRRKGTK